MDVCRKCELEVNQNRVNEVLTHTLIREQKQDLILKDREKVKQCKSITETESFTGENIECRNKTRINLGLKAITLLNSIL